MDPGQSELPSMSTSPAPTPPVPMQTLVTPPPIGDRLLHGSPLRPSQTSGSLSAAVANISTSSFPSDPAATLAAVAATLLDAEINGTVKSAQIGTSAAARFAPSLLSTSPQSRRVRPRLKPRPDPIEVLSRGKAVPDSQAASPQSSSTIETRQNTSPKTPDSRNSKSGIRFWSASEDAKLRQAVEALGGRNWKRIAALAFPSGTRSDIQCLHRWKKVLRPGLVKGPWKKHEDEMVVKAVMKVGVKNIKWSSVAVLVPGRLGKQVRERWYNHLDPQLNKGPWTKEEDDMLVQLQKELGNKWVKIAERMPGRSENGIKNRWNSAKRRKNSKKQKQSKQQPRLSKGRQRSSRSTSERQRSQALRMKGTAKRKSSVAASTSMPQLSVKRKRMGMI